MAMMMDQQQQQTHKHHCRICKKGFGCGRALGGHMRAHGINDDPVGEKGDGADDDPSACGSDWADDKLSAPATHRRMYALRTNPHRLRTCRACENCGKEFSSWKAFLEHGRCASPGEVDHGDESMVSSPRSDGAGAGVAEDDDPAERRGCMGWSKGKRSRRTKVAAAGASSSYCLSSQEEDLANCLVMLSAGRVEPMIAVETEESCASASKEEDRRNPTERSAALPAVEKPRPSAAAAAPPRGMFECKACKKVFSSHQALGGHRASHKKVKGCFAARLDDLDESPPEEEVITRDHAAAAAMAGADEGNGPLAIVPFDQAAPPGVAGGPPLKKKSKLHECSICHRVFTSGQALGGHKRCHWITSNAAPDPASMAKLHQMQAHAQAQHHQLLQLRPMFDKSEPLDLNLPAPADDVAGARPELEAPLSLDVPALFLQPWTDGNTNIKHHNTKNNNNSIHTNSNTNYNNNSNNNNTCNLNDVDDEADSKIKLAKLSDLKDLNMGGDSSSWLQVGIGSSTKRGREP